MAKATSSGRPPSLPETAPFPHAITDCDAWVMPLSQRQCGFVRSVRRAYQHAVCGLVTTMIPEIAETFATDPQFYTHTFCAHCCKHSPVTEFFWCDDDSIVGT